MKTKFSVTLLAVAIALLIVSMLFGDLIYQKLVVPRLSEWPSVPIWWWLLMIAPFYLICLIVGSKLRTWTELVIFSVSAMLVSHAYDFIAANVHAPGTLKSFAVEAPLYFWTIGALAKWVLVAIVMGVGFVVGKKLKLWETGMA